MRRTLNCLDRGPPHQGWTGGCGGRAGRSAGSGDGTPAASPPVAQARECGGAAHHQGRGLGDNGTSQGERGIESARRVMSVPIPDQFGTKLSLRIQLCRSGSNGPVPPVIGLGADSNKKFPSANCASGQKK